MKNNTKIKNSLPHNKTKLICIHNSKLNSIGLKLLLKKIFYFISLIT